MPESEFEKTYLRDPQVDLAAHVGDPARSPEVVADVPRTPAGTEPPVPGAQWDEVHGRWEVWDEATGAWVVAGEGAGDGVVPADENPLPSALAREAHRGDELIADDEVVPDVPRSGPVGPAPPGAQWNEIAGRWERWDEASGSWVEATADPEPQEAPEAG